MAKKKKKVVYKIPDLCDYANMGFNPFVQDQETLDKLNNEYDPATLEHRRRLAKWKEREKERAALAKKLGVTTEIKLTPASEILDMLPR